MKPFNTVLNQYDLFKIELDKIVDRKDPLIRLADLINWDYLHKELSKYYNGKTGKPPKSIRLMVGLLILEYCYNLHDKEVISNLERNVFYQYFCGFFTIQSTKIISRSTLVKFRKRIGKEGAGIIFAHTVDIAKQLGILKKGEKKVITDTTAIEKNIKYPTDIELLETTRKKLIKEAKKQNLIKRDKYASVSRS